MCANKRNERRTLNTVHAMWFIWIESSSSAFFACKKEERQGKERECVFLISLAMECGIKCAKKIPSLQLYICTEYNHFIVNRISVNLHV